MERVLALGAAVFHQFQTFRVDLLVLFGRIARYARKPAVLAFRAFYRHNNTVALRLRHGHFSGKFIISMLFASFLKWAEI